MTVQNQQTCFCTLALGKKYRSLAQLLAKDLAQHSPHTPLVILTDEVPWFKDHPNVLAVEHRQQGVKCYHDKRFAIKRALSQFETCIFIDADMRITGEVLTDLQWKSGITARTGCGITKHNQTRSKDLAVIQNVAKKWNLSLEAVSYVNEFLFTVSRDAGKEIEFLKNWDAIASYFEVHGVYDGEGNAIGLAAAKAGLEIRFDRVDRFPFFKDRIEQVRIRNGEADPKVNLAYFEEQRKYEYPQQSIVQKICNKVMNRVAIGYRVLHLRIHSFKDFRFYYR